MAGRAMNALWIASKKALTLSYAGFLLLAAVLPSRVLPAARGDRCRPGGRSLAGRGRLVDRSAAKGAIRLVNIGVRC